MFSFQTETVQVGLELIVLNLFAQGIEKLLGDKKNISTRVERMLGHIRKVTHLFKHKPFKGDQQD